MRIGYLLTWRQGAMSGVFAKVSDQVHAWESMGHQVGVFVATTPEALVDWQQLPQLQTAVTGDGAVGSIRAQSALLKALRLWAPDITYVRTSPRQASAARQLHRLPHVIEIQTDDRAEAQLASLPRRALAMATRRPCLSGARGMVFVSRELSQSASYDFATKNRVVIGNGIDLERVEALPPAPREAPLRLAFMGAAGAPWHGVEQLYALARIRPEWGFDIIGPTLVDGQPSLPNVLHHGELGSADYIPILAQATVGVGTLALHTKGMHEASPLKSREYLACGLPVIGAYEDTDIPDSSDVYLRLPNRAGAIVEQVLRVEAFIDSWAGRRVSHEDIAYLDTKVKEAERLAFLQLCAAS